ncbi:outer membrane protein assembly factor BamB family protein [Fibrivirga algicola]|uniref:PQQ-binding-like beta-propeller repeat protein n=1 Tax=Fibrivirga algicola TaxID=2950420 RepID=A0ABX0QLQ0_9BACT|nr:PQQ-binding-like beta-propeller repeat protein [Fibrivirga algicola]NID13421.1 PQQ-binding-like beta-propeller repeat protein [Fibrivirga algicola]
MKKVLFVLITAVCWFGCRSNEDVVIDTNGVATKLPHLWGTSISNNGELAEVVTEAQIVYNTKYILAGANRDNKRFLVSLNSETGKVEWEWSDLMGLLNNPNYLDPISLDEDDYYLYQGKLVFHESTSTYCIDLNEGSTFWKHKVNLTRFPQAGGFNNLYFNSGKVYDSQADESLFGAQVVGNTVEEKLVTPTYDFNEVDANSSAKGRIWQVLSLEQDSDVMLAILFSDPAKTGRRYPTNMGLYNLSQKKWVYERATLNGSYPDSNVSWAKLYDGKVYHTSTRSMQCHDVMTGKEIWTVNFDQGFGSSGFIIQDGKIFGNNDNRFTYCLDPATGRQLWKEESSGSASPISYLNGVLYFMGGGDGRLHAIDAATGKHLWKLRSPDVDKNSGAYFYGTCVAVPGQGGSKGRIVATTGLNAYGYEAIR